MGFFEARASLYRGDRSSGSNFRSHDLNPLEPIKLAAIRSNSLAILANEFSAQRITSRATDKKSRALISSLKSNFYRWNQTFTALHRMSHHAASVPIHTPDTILAEKAGTATNWASATGGRTSTTLHRMLRPGTGGPIRTTSPLYLPKRISDLPRVIAPATSGSASIPHTETPAGTARDRNSRPEHGYCRLRARNR